MDYCLVLELPLEGEGEAIGAWRYSQIQTQKVKSGGFHALSCSAEHRRLYDYLHVKENYTQ